MAISPQKGRKTRNRAIDQYAVLFKPFTFWVTNYSLVPFAYFQIFRVSDDFSGVKLSGIDLADY